jgi:hypothetical protein
MISEGLLDVVRHCTYLTELQIEPNCDSLGDTFIEFVAEKLKYLRKLVVVAYDGGSRFTPHALEILAERLDGNPNSRMFVNIGLGSDGVSARMEHNFNDKYWHHRKDSDGWWEFCQPMWERR